MGSSLCGELDVGGWQSRTLSNRTPSAALTAFFVHFLLHSSVGGLLEVQRVNAPAGPAITEIDSRPYEPAGSNLMLFPQRNLIP